MDEQNGSADGGKIFFDFLKTTAQQEQLTQAANDLYGMFTIFTDAGFTEAQAMELIKNLLFRQRNGG